jgi:hypothetical protein
MESDRHARSGLGVDARNPVGAGFAAPAVWRNERLDRDLDAAMTVLVPFYLVTHGVIFAKLMRAGEPAAA